MKARIAMIAMAVALLSAVALAGPNSKCRVGVQVHLRSGGSPEPYYLRHLRAFVENGIADYVMLVCQGLTNVEREDAVRYLAAHDVAFMLQDTWSGPKRHYTRADVERLTEIAGKRFLGVHWGELDSSGMRPEDYLSKETLANPTRRAIHDAFVTQVRKDAGAYRDGSTMPIAHSSATLSHSLFAEAGVDVLCSEIGENAPNMSMMIASNRGAARAYGRPWMIDHSTWWSPRGNVDELVSPREGHTPWCLFTSLLDAAMGGADYVQLEVDWAAYDGKRLSGGAGDPGPLLPWGVALKNLSALAREIGSRGETMTPFGVLVSSESGWPGVGWRIGDVRGTGLFDGIRHQFMQARDADLSLKALDIFYPGFERCAWDPEYPGFLSESPFGPLDLVPDNVPADRYARYRVLVALGYHRATPAMRDALRKYVEGGGVLVCSDTLLLDERERPAPSELAEPLIGCVVDARPASLVRLWQPQACMDDVPGYAASATRGEWQAHWLHPIRLTTGNVIARMNGIPYIVQNRIGAGRVFYVTALNMVGSDSTRRGQEPFLYANTLYQFLHGLNARMGDGVRFAPWTSLQHILNEKPDGSAMLLVMNHGDMPYRRDARLRNTRGYSTARLVARGNWEAYQPGGPIELKTDGDSLTWSFEMAPKTFALFELRK